ncbi:Ribonuclease H-like protein [Glarea lozoyensis ATCC 20868]|uniref:Ribonuclease H-like protein n=1 Tax=Glarea lozoyensis (strain ATCC 20868 / MF5171) TaxID=1116229 RepID=S3CS63_GLAL2|nr:Ribonuclease H-like protein [Glarea lozoyensis ATCC 20868]EPE27909.1 Ribonuclease H-like protein [Glarea lozoyensis ATCC 20868]
MFSVNIFSDSRYVINCMETWLRNWRRNGWRTASGKVVRNRNLIRHADDLQAELRSIGDLTYNWIPREDNDEADWYCNDVMGNNCYMSGFRP